MNINNNIIVIDIRDEHELNEKYLDTTNLDIKLINIPSRNIKFNKDYIVNLSESNKVYIVCKSGNRSSKIKELYFKNNKNIISLEGGIENINKLDTDIEIKKGDNKYGMNQYMQIIFMCILLFITLLIYLNVDKKIILSILILIIFFIYYQIYTKSCILSKIVPF